jgi:hypothetical protein
MAPPFFKQTIVNGGRASSGAPALPPMLQANAAQDIHLAAAMKSDSEYFPMLAGQSMGIIHDLPSPRDVVRALVEEAVLVRKRLLQPAE